MLKISLDSRVGENPLANTMTKKEAHSRCDEGDNPEHSFVYLVRVEDGGAILHEEINNITSIVAVV